MVAHSQLAPLPVDVPFNIISNTIGSGAYACIKKACMQKAPSEVFAVKFINKQYALRHNIRQSQLNMEQQLHKAIGDHVNVIHFKGAGEDTQWAWIAMELAEGGDLFDKIESDVGVGEDIAHFYFTQLVSAVEFIHARGIAHRDLKPENLLLSADGNLKVADFGLAILFNYRGKEKLASTRCGSPPYTAPEILASEGRVGGKVAEPYRPNVADIWSCGIILFVLLVGNTPWDEALDRSYEFHEYIKAEGIPDDELWHNLPPAAITLLKGMLCVQTGKRFSVGDIRRHQWTKRGNAYLDTKGRAENPIGRATEMFESMKIDFSQDPLASQASQSTQKNEDAMDIDGQSTPDNGAVTSAEGIEFEWERPSQLLLSTHQQPSVDDLLNEDPSLSQFSATPQVPLTKTQIARQFRDICPAQALTRFYALCKSSQITSMVLAALQQLGIDSYGEVDQPKQNGADLITFRIKGMDMRNCLLVGMVTIQDVAGASGQLISVSFVRMQGDPVQWRRLFKKVVLLCKEVVLRPEEHLALLSQA